VNQAIPVEQFGQWLDGLLQPVEKPQAEPALREWLDGFKQFIAECFANSQSPFGEGWPSLEHPRSKGHNQDPRPLIDTQTLMQSVTTDEGIIELDDQHLRFGTQLPYAAYQQQGTKSIPARVFLGVPEDEATRAADIFAKHLIQTLGTPVAA
jgi:phage gpG-like protein